MELSLADGGTALLFDHPTLANGGIMSMSEAAEQRAVSSDVSDAGVAQEKPNPAWDDHIPEGYTPTKVDPSSDMGMTGYKPPPKPTYDQYKANVFGLGHIKDLDSFADPREAVNAFNTRKRQEYAEVPKLTGDSLSKRQSNAQFFSPNNWKGDRELNAIFDHFGVDGGRDRQQAMRNFSTGDRNVLKQQGRELQNEQFLTAMNNLGNSRRIEEEGVSDSDLLPGMNVKDFMGGVVGSHNLAMNDNLFRTKWSGGGDGSYVDDIRKIGGIERFAGIMHPGNLPFRDYEQQQGFSFDEPATDPTRVNSLMRKMKTRYDYGYDNPLRTNVNTRA